ncbi:MAG: hypothetical protein F6K24_28165 [Okeania sp. SIO2D1]|nr:hypothetical protein [Okeania sp. SIO2D1]
MNPSFSVRTAPQTELGSAEKIGCGGRKRGRTRRTRRTRWEEQAASLDYLLRPNFRHRQGKSISILRLQ